MASSPDLVAQFEFDPEFNHIAAIRGTKAPVLVGPAAWWCTRTPNGPATARIEAIGPATVTAQIWGEGSDWIKNQVPRLLGTEDDTSGFVAEGHLDRLWRSNKFKLGRTDILWDALVGAVFSQKVQVTRAKQSVRALAKKFGEDAPGPSSGRLLPSYETVAQLSYADLHPLGIERKRAQALINGAKEMPRLISDQTKGSHQVKDRLESLAGIGPWTSNLVVAAAMGDSDAVPVGDYHIPNTVAWLLAGEARANDARMLELLEPYRGHRWRVIRLAKMSGSAPKFGPKLSLRGFGIQQAR